MAKDRSQKSALFGALIILVIVAIALFVFFIPDIFRSFTRSIEIVAVMPDAGALDDGSPVWIAGREVGSVLSVELRPADVDSSRRVAVRMQIPTEYSHYVRKDSEVRVTSERLIGAPVLDILPGSAGTAPIRDMDTLVVRPAGNLSDLLDKTMRLNASFARFFHDMETVERRTGNSGAALARLGGSLEGALSELRELTGTLQHSPMRTFSDPAFRRILADVNRQNTQLGNAFRTAAERARRAQSDARPSLERLAARTDTIRSIVADIQARIEAGGGGLLIRAQRDSAVVKGLHAAQVQLDSLIAVTKRNPLRFWF